MEIIKKISEFGDSFFEWILKGIIPLPGIVKGIIVIVVLVLVAIGILTLLKKSFKVFGIILLAILTIIIVSGFLS